MSSHVFRLSASLTALTLLLGACGAAPEPTPLPTIDPALEVPRVVADGRVLPARDASLRFLGSGIVAEVLIAEGDEVAAGAALARLEAAELEAQVAARRAALDEASASYELLIEGAGPEAVAAAQARLDQAAAGARQAEAAVGPSDLAAARAQLQEAQARLDRLTAGPNTEEVEQARAALSAAEAGLASARDSLSAAKADAALRQTGAANLLRDAQAEYSRIYWENRELDRQPGDLPQARVDAEAAALRAVESARAELERATLAYEQSRQAEINGIAAAEADLRAAQARLDQLLAGANADEIAAARAQVAQAQASLAHLSGDTQAGSLEAAQAGVAQAQAELAALTAPPRAAELAAAEARVRASQAALRQAEIALEHATLRAPFAGMVVEVNLEPGEQPDPAAPAVVMADLSGWRIETSDLTELDVVHVREGDQATLSFDALPELSLPGVITRVRPLGKTFQGDVIYTVVIEPVGWDERLRWNMTATVVIGPAQ